MQLIKKVQKGDKRAFDLLVAKYQHKIISLINGMVKNPSEAQDIAQDVFIKAYKAMPKFRGDSQFYTWLYRIAINTTKNYLSSSKRRLYDNSLDVDTVQVYEHSHRLRDNASPDKILQQEQLSQELKRVLKAMPNDLRTALTLREFHELNYEDIAEIMKCPVGTVRSRISRAREAFDEVIGKALDYEQ